MVAFFQRIYGMINDMVAGKVDFIINSVKDVLVKLLPLAIELLASVLNVGGIAEKVSAKLKQLEEYIIKVTEPIVSWIVKVAKSLFAGAGKLFDKVKGKITSWFGIREEFKAKNGEVHHMYFEGSEKNYRLMVASTPKSLEDIIKQNVKEKDKKDELLKLKNSLYDKIQKHLSSQSSETKETDSFKSIIESDLRAIQEKLAPYLTNGDRELPLTNITYSMNDKRANVVTANPLTKLSGNTKGSGPGGANPKGWDHAKVIEKSGIWVRAHLVNEHLHGPGENWNLVPARQWFNKQMSQDIEEGAKSKVEAGKILKYVSQVNEWTDIPNEPLIKNYFPLKITVEYWYKDTIAAEWSSTSIKKEFSQGRPKINRDESYIDLNTQKKADLISTAKDFETKDSTLTKGDKINIANAIFDVRSSGIFVRLDNFESRMGRYFDNAYKEKSDSYMEFSILLVEHKYGRLVDPIISII